MLKINESRVMRKETRIGLVERARKLRTMARDIDIRLGKLKIEINQLGRLKLEIKKELARLEYHRR